MEVLEGEGYFCEIDGFVFIVVKFVEALFEEGYVEGCFGEKGFGGELFGLFAFEFFEEEVLFDVGELIMEVI